MRRLLAPLLAACALPAALAGQGIGRPPIFDPAVGEVRNTLQYEGSVTFDDGGPWFGSTGIRYRRDWKRFGLAAGAGLLAARDVGSVFALSGQYKPGMLVLMDGDERTLWLTGGPLLDISREANDPFGQQFTITPALALATVFGFPGFTIELSAAPRYEFRFVSTNGLEDSQNVWGVQGGIVAGVARFVQLMFAIDYADHGYRPAGAFLSAGAWTIGAGLRTRLPG